MIELWTLPAHKAFDILCTQLSTKGYFSLPRSPAEHQGYAEAVAAFGEFLKLPSEIKRQIAAFAHDSNEETYIGWREKPGKKPWEDDKELFHYHYGLEEKCVQSDAMEHPTVTRFLGLARRIYAANIDYSMRFFRVLDVGFPGTYDSIFSSGGSPPELHDRYIAYYIKDNGEIGDSVSGGDDEEHMVDVAAEHGDRGTGARTGFETHPGLYFRHSTLNEKGHSSSDRERDYISPQHDASVFFPGTTFFKTIPPDFPNRRLVEAATLHGVAVKRARREIIQARGKREPVRMSMVHFYNDRQLHLTRTPWERTHPTLLRTP